MENPETAVQAAEERVQLRTFATQHQFPSFSAACHWLANHAHEHYNCNYMHEFSPYYHHGAAKRLYEAFTIEDEAEQMRLQRRIGTFLAVLHPQDQAMERMRAVLYALSFIPGAYFAGDSWEDRQIGALMSNTLEHAWDRVGPWVA